MNWVTGVLVYVVLWFVALFCVLPIGVKPIGQPGPGYGTGAPENPRTGFKLLLATGIALGLFGVVYLLVRSDWISFRRS
jgi:predicted secreted protein